MRQATYGVTQMTVEMKLLEARLQDMEKELSTMVVGSKQWQLLSQSIEEVKQAMLDLEQEINELEPATGKIVTAVKDLAQEMSLLTKEYDAGNQAVSESIKYYNDMIDLVNRTGIILQTELWTLKEGTEEWYKKKEAIADNARILKDLTASLEELTEPLEGLDLIAAKMGILGDSIKDTKAKIELLNERAVLLQKALDKATPDTKGWWAAKTAYEANKTAIDGLITKYGELTDSYQRYIDVMKPVEDRLFELSHTEEEVAARNLLAKKQQLEEGVRAADLSAEKEKEGLTKIQEWYDKEIEVIIKKIEEKKEAEIESAKTTEESANAQTAAIRKIKDEYAELITKIEDMGKAAEAAAEAAAKAVRKAESEAVLAEIPTLAETGYVPPYIPELQRGTPYVPKTGLYKLHVGEKVTPPGQNTYNQQKSYSPTINITIQGDGEESKVRRIVEQALQESARQFDRSGNVLVPGMA
ncbi:hypothetical protein ES705_36976 [subsurface metagenome]